MLECAGRLCSPVRCWDSLLGTVHAQPASALHPCNGLAITLQAVGNPTIGGPGDDVIGGTPDADVIDGGGGDDTICGWGGDDVLERGRRRLDLGR